MRAPRVLQVVHSLNPGGTERLVLEISRRLHAEIPMAVCCLDDSGTWAPELEAVGIDVTWLGRKPGFRPSLGHAVARAAKRHRATLMHAHHYSPMIYVGLARFWTPTTRVIFTEHGRLSYAPPTTKRLLATRVIGRIPSRNFAVCDELRQHMFTEGFRKGAVDVIYNGIEVGPLPDVSRRTAVRSALAVADDVLVVGAIARLDPLKNLGMLINAIGQIRGRVRTKLIIVGDGEERRHLEEEAIRAGAEADVIFLGHRDDARDWLAGCDVYVNCSLSEGLSLTILEAMAAGLPVVATEVGGSPEVVDDSCGRLGPSGDAAALAARLLELAGEPALRRELGRVARHRVETRFTLGRMVSEYRDVYNGVR